MTFPRAAVLQAGQPAAAAFHEARWNPSRRMFPPLGYICLRSCRAGLADGSSSKLFSCRGAAT